MKTTNSIKVFCDILDGEICVESISNKDNNNEKYGDLLALSFLIIRLISVTRKSDIKDDFIDALRVGSGYVWSVYPNLLSGHADEWASIELGDNANGESKRGFILDMSYDSDGHQNRLHTRGFGVFGRNVDYASFYFIISYYEYLLNKYPDNMMNEKINLLVNRALDFLKFAGGKVGTKDEYIAVENLTKEQIKI